ncbi:methylmalonyl-CoA mutase [Pseudonocardia acidicola]|uniref:Methylmalonyl-CoA mutase n=1 Tax=Pseudonocardia acidicola TaxID=2724939 RepID=A0ABX1SE12_9PSEU|nr:methylmalonyl-CoA mutase [Pseudonocardia acidicola]NMH99092.1 methylmalonyl-CoA mutase [Pseudonocardia acidicola]
MKITLSAAGSAGVRRCAVGERLRVVLVTPGDAESDTRAAMALARTLRDGGMEVVLTAAGPTPDQIVRTALQEDAGAIGFPEGAPDAASAVRRLLAERDAADVAVVVAGADAGPGILDELRAAVARATAP